MLICFKKFEKFILTLNERMTILMMLMISFYPVLNHPLFVPKAIGLMFPNHLSMILPISEKVFCQEMYDVYSFEVVKNKNLLSGDFWFLPEQKLFLPKLSSIKAIKYF